MSIIGSEAYLAKPPAPEDFLKDVPLELFGGKCSEMEPGDLPQGASPFCQDVDFKLGAVFTRSGLTAVFAGQISGSVNYVKTFTLPTGAKQLLLLDSAGNFYYEDTTNNPGTLVKIASVLPESFAHSVTAFGREFIAFHNRLKGTDIPRQWDGTNFDRVTQDGPGSPPVVADFLPPGATLQGGGVGAAVNIAAAPTGAVTTDFVTVNIPAVPPYFPGGTASYYTTATYTTTAPHGLTINTVVTIAGVTNGLFNVANATIIEVPSPTTFKISLTSGTLQTSGSGTVTPQNPTLSRAGNTVTAMTPAPHGFLPGWSVQISGFTAALVGGAATATQQNGAVTVTTTTPHGLTPGSIAIVAGMADATYDTPGGATVLSVPSPTTFTYQQNTSTASTSGGTVSSPWNTIYGPVVIASTPTPTTFTYVQPGPNLQNSNAGTATIVGNIAPGTHKVSQAFLTRQGYITRFSPPATWTAAGGQMAALSSLAIGPSNVVARVLSFTAAGGDYFFFILVPTTGSATGTIVSDNTSTHAIIDFADATLLASESADQPGTNVFGLVTLEPCLGVNTYADRMAWWGELSAVTSLLNPSFDGGFSLGTGTGGSDVPLGWTSDSTNGAGGSQSTDAVWGSSYKITGDGATALRGMITQGASTDYLNVPILLANTSYSARVRLKVTGAPVAGKCAIELYSATSGSLGIYQVDVSVMGTTSFSLHSGVIGSTGVSIPTDLVLRVYASNTLSNAATITVDELAIFPTAEPTFNSQVRMSYVINPESFDGVTGALGLPGLRQRPVTATGQIRDNFYITGDPGLFETADNGTTEPDGWTINTISAVVGTPSVDGLVSGEEWLLLMDRKGEYICNGNEPVKISQEIQPDWSLINPAAAQTIWAVNDVANRRVMIGVPINGATVPNNVYMMAYTELNTSIEIADQKPLHLSYMGRMVSWDMSRKWCPWNIYANCGAVVDRQDGSQQVFFGNNLGANKVYMLDSTSDSDDGAAIVSIYYPFFFVNRDMEQALQMGLHRKVFDYITMFISGSGTLTTTAIADSMTSPRVKILATRVLSSNPGNDLELGVNYTGERVSFGVSTATVGSWFKLSKMVCRIRQDPFAPIRGIAVG